MSDAAEGHAAGAAGTPAPLTRQLTSHLDNVVDNLAGLKYDGPKLEASAKDGTAEHIGHFKFLVGEATDIGGGSVNQDTYEVFRTGASKENLVLAVFDGHGRELGELAAIVARDKIRSLLEKDEIMNQVFDDPEGTLTDVFRHAHNEIKARFRQKYEEANFQVRETDEGYLIKRKTSADSWTCTHGGTTGTVVIIFGATNRMIVANVGDSTALFGGVDENNDIVFQELSAEHSPESVTEFKRARAFRSDETGVMPEMRFVYDSSPCFFKNQCPPVFEVDPKDANNVRVTGKGSYYKNVRNEWATLVTTPAHARFQDALAFTRSLGDLHLHVYGVSSTPEVVEYDIAEFHNGASANEFSASCLLVCTDGVWDNWRFNDIVEQAMKPDMIASSIRAGDGKDTCLRLMEANIQLARNHFGPQADNMTAILCYVVPAK